MSARSQVESLLAIITEAAHSALDEYEKFGAPTPTLECTDVHPLDVADDRLRLKKIISSLEGACEQLCTTLAPPSHTIMNRAQDFGWACLRVAVRHKVADELAKHPDGLHVDALSRKIHIHPMKLASILRVLAARHCFREVSDDAFSNNRLSTNLIAGHSVSALVDLVTEEGQRPALSLADYLVDNHFGQSLDMSKAAFQYTKRDQDLGGLTFYEWLQQSSQQARRAVMMKAMVSMNSVLGSLAALHVYDWSAIRSVCDVGSGMGSFSRSLLSKCPEIRVTLFDVPEVLAIAKQHWEDDFSENVTFVEGDFFDKVPVPDCDIYYLRNILHNWTDQKAINILRTVKAAMGPKSRLLVHDNLLRHMSTTPDANIDKLDIAPEPMLPNYGAGQIRLYHLDLTMMMCYNTRERTVTEMINLGEKAGLHALKIIDLAEMCIIEFSALE